MNKRQKVYRHEKKYTLTWQAFVGINHKLKHILRRDPHCPPEGYEVKSLYFDNPYDHALMEKVHGDDQRHKYRIRVYNNDFDHMKLEKKSKDNVMTQKDSMYITLAEARRLASGNADFLCQREDSFAQTFHYKVAHEKLSPKVIVKYTRLAYTYPVVGGKIK